MSQAPPRDNRSVAALARRRGWGVARLFLVVGLVVFLVAAALLSRTAVQYTARVPVDLNPVLRAATGQATAKGQAHAYPPLGRLTLPGGMLAQAIAESGFDADVDLGDSAAQIAGHRSQRDAATADRSARLHVTTIEDGDEQRLVIAYTDASRETAASRAEVAAQIIADRFVELELQTARQAYQAVSAETTEARQAFQRANGRVDRLLASHFKQLGTNLKPAADSQSRASQLPAAARQADDEAAVHAPPAETPPLPRGTTVAQLESRLANLERQRTELLAKLTPLHPSVRAVDDQIETTNQQIAALRADKTPTGNDSAAEQNPALAESPVEMPAAPLADDGQEIVPAPWAQSHSPAPDESVPPPSAPPASYEMPIIAPNAPATVAVDQSRLEEMNAAIGSDTQSLDDARAYLARTSSEYRQAKLARDRAQGELERKVAAERSDWLRVERLTAARSSLGETVVTATGPKSSARRSIVGVAAACALVFGLLAAWGGAVATASFASVGEVESTLGVPVVGVIERSESSPRHRRTQRLRSWTGRASLMGELLLVAVVVWLAYLIASEPGFVEHLLTDPFEALCDAIW